MLGIVLVFNFFSGSPIDLFDGSEADHRLTNQCKLSIEAWLTGLIDKSLQNSSICSCFIFIYNPSFVQINFTMLDKYMHSVYCYKLVSKEFWSWQAVYISDMYFLSGYNKVKIICVPTTLHITSILKLSYLYVEDVQCFDGWYEFISRVKQYFFYFHMKIWNL